MDWLTGMLPAKVDDRGRVAIPARFMEQFRKIASAGGSPISPDEPLEVVISLDIEQKLSVFPKNVYQEFMEYLEKKPQYDPEWESISNMIIGSCEELPLDKQNRVKLPTVLAEYFELMGQDVVVMGAKRRLQIMSRKAWDESMAEMKSGLKRLSRPAAPPPAG